MKKAILFCLVLWGGADVLAAAAAVPREGREPASSGSDARICLELMDLGGNGEGGEDAMELPPMKGEKKSAPGAGADLGLKPPSRAAEPKAYTGKPLTVPGADTSPGLSPMILTRPAGGGEIQKLPMKPMDEDLETVPDLPGASAGRMSSELKPLEPVTSPSTGLKMSTTGRSGTPASFDSPEIPLLAEDEPGPKGAAADSGGAALSLKPAAPASGAQKPPLQVRAAVPDSGGLLEGGVSPFGNELDEKLIAIYERFYKTRK